MTSLDPTPNAANPPVETHQSEPSIVQPVDPATSAFAHHFFADPNLERGLIAAITADGTNDWYWKLLDHLPPGVFTECEAEFKQIEEAVTGNLDLPAFDFDPVDDPLAVAKTLADLYERRLGFGALVRAIEDIRTAKSAADVLRQHEAALTEVQQALQVIRDGKLTPMPELFPALLAKIREIYEHVQENGHGVVGIETGMQILDATLGGLQPGLHVIAAPPGAGKTTITLNWGINASSNGIPVLFVSFEEAPERLALSAICCAAKLEKKAFWEGHADPAKLEQDFARVKPKLERLFLLQGSSKVTPLQVRQRALQIMKHCGSNRILIIIDYLQFWAGTQHQGGEFRLGVASLVSEIREIATALSSPIVLISSQSKGNQGSSSLISFKEAGEIEYTADTAMLIVDEGIQGNDDYLTPHLRPLTLVIAKNRNGDTARIKLNFEPALSRFMEVG